MTKRDTNKKFITDKMTNYLALKQSTNKHCSDKNRGKKKKSRDKYGKGQI